MLPPRADLHCVRKGSLLQQLVQSLLLALPFLELHLRLLPLFWMFISYVAAAASCVVLLMQCLAEGFGPESGCLLFAVSFCHGEQESIQPPSA